MSPQPRSDARSSELVAIGGSWGGTVATQSILRALPPGFPVPIVVALHRSARSNGEMLEHLLRDGVARRVCEVDDKTPLDAGCVYIAPADYHLLIEDGRVALSTEAPVNFSRPSIDVLLESAADEYGPGLVAVVLTGANDDGAAGVRHVLRRGGRVVIQDPAGAERVEMPTAAIAAAGGHADDPERVRVVPLDGIAPLLTNMFVRTRSR